jgi:hypothetical protein
MQYAKSLTARAGRPSRAQMLRFWRYLVERPLA